MQPKRVGYSRGKFHGGIFSHETSKSITVGDNKNGIEIKYIKSKNQIRFRQYFDNDCGRSNMGVGEISLDEFCSKLELGVEIKEDKKCQD